MAQADGAAPAVCGIVVDLHAAGNVDLAPAHQNGTAVQTGGVAGNLRAAGNVDRTIAAHIDGAAAGVVVALGRFIAGDGAAGHVDGAAGGGEERTAVLGRVILNRAAVHIEGAAGDVRLILIIFPENGAAIVFAIVVGNLTAVHVEHAILVIQSDGAAAATAGDLTAGELAAEHIKGACVEVDAGAAPDVLCRTFDCAAALTVAENKVATFSDLNLTAAIAGERLAIQTQVKCFSYHLQMSATGSIPRQVNAGGIVGVGNVACAVPRRICHVGMARMSARTDTAPAKTVRMRRLNRRRLVIGRRLDCDLGFCRSGGFLCRFSRFRLLLGFLLRVCRFLGIVGFVLLFGFILCAVLQGSVFRTAGGTLWVPRFRRTSGCADASAGFLALGKDRRRQRRQQHSADQQDAEPSFFHRLSSFFSHLVIGFPFCILHRMHSMVTTTPNTKAAMPTRMYAPAPSRSSTAL